MKPPRPIELDGRTGEGGGQLVRNAIALAAVVSQPVRITNVRGNRVAGSSSRKPGGGLKAQHVSAIEVLARATNAEVEGLSIGSHTLVFKPRRGPGADAVAALSKGSASESASAGPATSDDGEGSSGSSGKEKEKSRVVRIKAESAASSSMLIFQAVFPFLLFAGCDDGDEEQEQQRPIELEIEGGTNASWAPSFDYIDQVLCPALETWFGVVVERRLIRRGWNSGPVGHGKVWFKFRPIRPGCALGGSAEDALQRMRRIDALTAEDFAVKAITVTLVCPAAMHEKMTRYIAKDLAVLFPDAEVTFLPLEDSGHPSRMFGMLFARPAKTDSPLLWGRAMLFSGGGGKGAGMGKGGKGRKGAGGSSSSSDSSLSFTEMFSRKLCKALHADVVQRKGVVDEFLQDQLVIFQALAEGRSSFPRREVLTADVTEGEGNNGGDDELSGALDALRVGDEEELRRDRTDEPFGEGSLHTTTARWVTTELLPGVKWFDGGRVCEGVGLKVPHLVE